MSRIWMLVPLAIASIVASEPAYSCVMFVKLDLNDVRYADVVLVGRIVNYQIVRDEAFRRQMLASPKLSPDMRKFYQGKSRLINDYARFTVKVDQVLAGSVPKTISVTWDASTFGEPETMAAGSFLIALRRPSGRMPPLRGPSATIMPSREPNSLTVLQAPCSGAFIFESDSVESRRIQSILSASRR